MPRTTPRLEPTARISRPARGTTRKKTAAARPQVAREPAIPVNSSPGLQTNGLALRQLAHELNSLLDGSIRCVGLARADVQDRGEKGTRDLAAIDDGLAKAHAAMRHMAALLERAMRATHTPEAAADFAVSPWPPSASAMFDTAQSLQAVTNHLAGLLQPHAQSAGILLRFDIAADCRALPAGPLGPVLMNALRNAIEAAPAAAVANAGFQPKSSRAPRTSRKIIARIRRDANALDITITSPSGTKPAGHGLGLNLSEQIVREMGGELALIAAEDTTSLRVSVPLASLKTSHADSITSHG